MNTKLIIWLLFVSIIFVSCEDSLTEEPPTFISLSNFYQTSSDARTATDAIYKALHDGSGNSLYGRFWTGIDVATDDVVTRVNKRTYDDWFSHTIGSNHVWLESYNQYQGLWTGIGRANDVIKNVALMETIEDEEKNLYIGEARALRAFFYFHLVRAWGDMPLVVNSITSVEDYDLPRSSVDEVYEQIIVPDLIFAEQHCADELHTGRITKWTSKLLLSEVYLTRAGWRRTSQGQFVQGDPVNFALARDKAKEIIDSSPHSLITTPYVNGAHTTPACGVAWLEGQPYSEESMFEIGSVNIRGVGSFLSRDCHPSGTGRDYWGVNNNAKPLESEGIDLSIVDMKWPLSPNVGGISLPSPDLAAAFEPGDERRDWAILTRYITPEGDNYLAQPTFRKHMDIDYFLGKDDTSFLNTQNNFIAYRYADALLIYAEAQNEADGAPSAEAYDAVNEIRNRAGLGDLIGLSQDEFRAAVWKERRIEFCAEMKRRFDLIRTNRLFTETENMHTTWTTALGSATDYSIYNVLYGTASWPDHEWLFPIPQSEMNLNRKNNWIQNAGYPDVVSN
ncbi:RagB/SusD family nutrient uptake outer membrane protein [Tamlana sp. 1_MG-2023]|uniref:RagB/SusD family nutrient uptake outer membrane protein n=1 Tax=Tamlana sp. 1_MG-2023 TaxID=3062628 RepID=UPI0026E28B6C|nr:RagB/SusD family nutrient uptake outer membrane protein [Tamlana sp. 1_MG-2023]MDO6792594.1 RagB/SusD family nutrient uptake outer membrane protein [Tamlana sp. 1_MG-2023]